jgi:hypothetical protein
MLLCWFRLCHDYVDSAVAFLRTRNRKFCSLEQELLLEGLCFGKELYFRTELGNNLRQDYLSKTDTMQVN